jgi:hypothetical protein
MYDWLVTYAGAERALEQIIALFPESDLYSQERRVSSCRDDMKILFTSLI